MNFRNIESPHRYLETAVIAQEAGKEMGARLDWMTIQPTIILDLGCGTGEHSAQLKNRYPDAAVIALDLSEAMIQHTKSVHHSVCLCADALKLPLKNQSVDLIFANFLLPWQIDFSVLLRECKRILRPNGLLMLTALGLDTLKEWQTFFGTHRLPQLIDMHDLGDQLVQEKFAEPVLDTDYYTLIYQEKEKFIRELFSSGMLNLSDAPFNLEAIPEKISATFEVIFAHAFAPIKEEYAATDGVTKVPLTQLRRQLQK